MSFSKILRALSLFIWLINVIFTIGWLLFFIIKFYATYKMYKVCKQTPILHPLYSDVQFLSKQRSLYNIKTHITKNVIMIICCCVEIFNFIWLVVGILIELEFKRSFDHANNSLHSDKSFPNCTLRHMDSDFYSNSVYIPLYDVNFICFLSLFFLLSLLSRYLAVRYLIHPFKRILIKYLIWFTVQVFCVAFDTTIYTVVLGYITFPILILISWVVFVKDSLILRRAIKSNLMEVKYFANDDNLYRQKLSLFKYYRTVTYISYISTFLLIVNINVGYFGRKTMKLISKHFCFFSLVYNIEIPASLQFPFPVNSWVFTLNGILSSTSLLMYAICVALPLWIVTISPVVLKLVRRCNDKERYYRFNYDNIRSSIN